MLKIAVHRDQDLAARMIDSGGDAGGLTEIRAQLDELDVAIRLGDFASDRIRVVAAAIVDEDDLVAAPGAEVASGRTT